jgi:hypothetical protein
MMPLALGMLAIELKLLSLLIVDQPAVARPTTTSPARRSANAIPRPSAQRTRRAPTSRAGKREAAPARLAPVQAEETVEKR